MLIGRMGGGGQSGQLADAGWGGMLSWIHEFGHRCVEFAGTIDRAVDNVLASVRAGDVVMTLGAGNVWQAGERLLEKLEGT